MNLAFLGPPNRTTEVEYDKLAKSFNKKGLKWAFICKDAVMVKCLLTGHVWYF